MADTWQEWTLFVDCAKNGCSPRHGDDGDHTRVWDRIEDVPDKINGHAATLMTRLVTRTEWVADERPKTSPTQSPSVTGAGETYGAVTGGNGRSAPSGDPS